MLVSYIKSMKLFKMQQNPIKNTLGGGNLKRNREVTSPFPPFDSTGKQ